jgi:2-oxoglutarate ferredoxin oxidoreductase subunit gamma
MLERILIAGSGGQGVVVAGKLLAAAAARSVPHVTFFPSYGAEVRGGTSNSQVILSSQEIASPLAEVFEAMLILNASALKQYLPLRSARSLLIVNTSMCPGADLEAAVGVPATDLADEMGDTRAANLIMLGVLLRHKPLIASACLEAEIRHIFSARKQDIVQRNLRAFRAGLEQREF